MVTALDIEWFVFRAAVQNSFIAAETHSDRIQRLDDFQTKLLALMVFGYGHFFDVSTNATIVDTNGGVNK